ncbi:MAG: hypothetical protein AB4062_09740 [Crocosphaera sp.]
MTCYLTLSEILRLHFLLIQQSGGLDGIRDQGSLESTIAFYLSLLQRMLELSRVGIAHLTKIKLE